MLSGYMRVSTADGADGSQVLDLQRDVLPTVGLRPEHLYEDPASGRRPTSPPA